MNDGAPGFYVNARERKHALTAPAERAHHKQSKDTLQSIRESQVRTVVFSVFLAGCSLAPGLRVIDVAAGVSRLLFGLGPVGDNGAVAGERKGDFSRDMAPEAAEGCSSVSARFSREPILPPL